MGTNKRYGPKRPSLPNKHKPHRFPNQLRVKRHPFQPTVAKRHQPQRLQAKQGPGQLQGAPPVSPEDQPLGNLPSEVCARRMNKYTGSTYICDYHFKEPMASDKNNASAGTRITFVLTRERGNKLEVVMRDTAVMRTQGIEIF